MRKKNFDDIINVIPMEYYSNYLEGYPDLEID